MTATLVWVDGNSLVYRIDNVATLGTSVTITSTGAATPDLVTDAANTSFGQAATALRKIVRAGLDGLGTIAAAGFTQATARALYLGDASTTIGGVNTPRARIRTQMRTVAADAQLQVDCNVAAGVPTIVVTAAAVAFNAYLYVELDHSISK
ncbi:MAG TPA: hypothetical protein VF183_04765 [Acidimicrobiales bacterium]